MSLYYLLSSLPLLAPDTAPALSPEAFLSACRDQLRPADAEAADALYHGRPSDHPFARAWRDKETVLRNAVARERARAAGREAGPWLRPAEGCDTYVESLVEDAFQEPDPLRREKALDRARWSAAEDLQGPDPLSVNAVFAYAVKLALLARGAVRQAGRGQGVFDALAAVPITLGAESQPHPEPHQP